MSVQWFDASASEVQGAIVLFGSLRREAILRNAVGAILSAVLTRGRASMTIPLFGRRRFAVALCAVCLMLTVAAPSLLPGQRRPGMNMGFYTTTDLLTGDVEGGSITSTTSQASAPRIAVSVLVIAPLKRASKRAWIAGVRATPIGFGNTAPCVRVTGEDGCQNGPFNERIAVLAGSAFDIRSTILRTMVGPTLYQVEGQGVRIGTTVRVDFGTPRLRGPTPILFYTRTFLGSQRGRAVALSSLGAGFRWVRKQ